jgi:DNA-directed RNA polymerase subunit E'/Rpb7
MESAGVIKQQIDKKDGIRKNKFQSQNQIGIYMSSMITRKVSIPMDKIGKNIKPLLEKNISSQLEGKCSVEGYIKPSSIKILTYSNGIINGSNVLFEVVFECLICSPVEGMHIDAIAKNITKAGIRAEYQEIPTPVVIFIARDHHYKSTYFSEVKEGDTIKVRVIGQRFELNDKYISVIAELIEPKIPKMKRKQQTKPILILED